MSIGRGGGFLTSRTNRMVITFYWSKHFENVSYAHYARATSCHLQTCWPKNIRMSTKSMTPASWPFLAPIRGSAASPPPSMIFGSDKMTHDLLLCVVSFCMFWIPENISLDRNIQTTSQSAPTYLKCRVRPSCKALLWEWVAVFSWDVVWSFSGQVAVREVLFCFQTLHKLKNRQMRELVYDH